MAILHQNGRTELRDKLTERSAEPVRSILAERSAEPFGFGRTLLLLLFLAILTSLTYSYHNILNNSTGKYFENSKLFISIQKLNSKTGYSAICINNSA